MASGLSWTGRPSAGAAGLLGKAKPTHLGSEEHESKDGTRELLLSKALKCPPLPLPSSQPIKTDKEVRLVLLQVPTPFLQS